MCDLLDTIGPISYFETPGENGNPSATTTRKNFVKELIRKADSVPIINIFRYYGLKLSEQNKKITCPFSFHQSGRESTASFYFYPDTNSFWCFGCKTGNRCCDFVSGIDNISKYKAAQKILELFSADIDIESLANDGDSFTKRLSIIIEFSDLIRNFRYTYTDDKSFEFIEEICKTYDLVSQKRELDNNALVKVIEKLKDRISQYEMSYL